MTFHTRNFWITKNNFAQILSRFHFYIFSENLKKHGKKLRIDRKVN